MARVKLTLSMGQHAEDVTQAAGDVVGTDTIAVNFDVSNMTRGAAVELLDEIKRDVLEGDWPRT